MLTPELWLAKPMSKTNFINPRSDSPSRSIGSKSPLTHGTKISKGK